MLKRLLLPLSPLPLASHHITSNIYTRGVFFGFESIVWRNILLPSYQEASHPRKSGLLSPSHWLGLTLAFNDLSDLHPIQPGSPWTTSPFSLVVSQHGPWAT